MRYNRSKSSDQNFWVSYADLMAGLLFVFILLIGAILIKFGYLQTDLSSMRSSLEEQRRVLIASEEELAKRKNDVASISDQLIAVQQQNDELTKMQILLNAELGKYKSDVNTTEEALLAARALLAEKGAALEDKEVKLEANAKEMMVLSQKLEDAMVIHKQYMDDLNTTRTRIKNITGIRLQVVQELKQKLGKNINIDPNSGAIRLPSSVLFDVDSYELRPEAKKQLKATHEPYLSTLLENDKIRENIDQIVIEGHTDSDGTYMHNLDLSQKRAYSVLAFIYSWDEKKNGLLQKYISANGRSYTDKLYRNGVEDKEASRRIEIKFNISNKKAVEELESFIGKK